MSKKNVSLLPFLPKLQSQTKKAILRKHRITSRFKKKKKKMNKCDHLMVNDLLIKKFVYTTL